MNKTPSPAPGEHTEREAFDAWFPFAFCPESDAMAWEGWKARAARAALAAQSGALQPELVWCGCGDGYPADSFEAGVMSATGQCSNCGAEPNGGAPEAPADKPSPRYSVAKASGSRYAYVLDSLAERSPTRFDIFKVDGWSAADKLCARLNAQGITGEPS